MKFFRGHFGATNPIYIPMGDVVHCNHPRVVWFTFPIGLISIITSLREG